MFARNVRWIAPDFTTFKHFSCMTEEDISEVLQQETTTSCAAELQNSKCGSNWSLCCASFVWEGLNHLLWMLTAASPLNNEMDFCTQEKCVYMCVLGGGGIRMLEEGRDIHSSAIYSFSHSCSIYRPPFHSVQPSLLRNTNYISQLNLFVLFHQSIQFTQ